MPKETKQTNEIYDWGNEESTGFESTNDSDFGIPYISLIQKGSPEYDEGHKDFDLKKIKDIKPGMIINSLSREVLYDRTEEAPLLFIPYYAQKMYREFKPRSTGGGFVQMHTSEMVLMRTKRNDDNKDVIIEGDGIGNEVQTTHYFYGTARSKDGSWTKVLLGFTSTQLKKGRSWLNLMSSKRHNGKIMPMFSHVYSLRSTGESNAEGSWFGWSIETNRVLDPAGDEGDKSLVLSSSFNSKELSSSNLALK